MKQNIILIASVVGAIVICVLAYKLNAAQNKIEGVTANPLGAIMGLFGSKKA
jgi:hypothetical protein